MKRFILFLFFSVLIAVFLPSQSLIAQHNDSGSAATTFFPDTSPKVTGVRNLAEGHNNELRVGDRICLDVRHLNTLLAKRKTDTSSLLLFVNGVPMTDIKATYYCDTVAFFHLKRGEGTDPWDVFYQSPAGWTIENVSVSLGYYEGCAVDTIAQSDLIIIRKGYFYIALFLIILLFILLYYAVTKGMLRDDSSLPLAQRPFSLGRSQLAFWTFIISVSYVFIALVTGELAPLTTSSLILLGISGLTTAVANTIDNSDKQNNNSRQQDTYKSDGFLNDILSDSNGVSVHRLQMLIFTMILGIFFIRQVFTTLQMPDFDNNMLALMGLSSVTYAGLKANENKNKDADIVNPQITDTTNGDIPPVR